MNVKWRLSHARGYLELGMPVEAEAELAHIPVEAQDTTEFLSVSAFVLHEKRDWPTLMKTAGELCARQPENSGWWIMLAYATRRAESLRAAELILMEAERRHPREATIQFNLGCYACQRGDLERARLRVQSAIALDEHFREAAKTDPDLEPLRQAAPEFPL